MEDTLITVVAFVLGAVLMLGFPLATVANNADTMSQVSVQNSTVEYVDKIRTTGKLSLEDYTKFIQEISATGNSYDVEIEIKVLDENPGKKTTQASSTRIGENVSYSMYTSQILDILSSNNEGTSKVLALKEGDMFSTSVRNTNTTLSQQLKNFFYTVAGNDTYTIAAEHGGYVTANGSGN